MENRDAGSQSAHSLARMIVEVGDRGVRIVEKLRAAAGSWDGAGVTSHRGTVVIKDRIGGRGVLEEVSRATAPVGPWSLTPSLRKWARGCEGIVFKLDAPAGSGDHGWIRKTQTNSADAGLCPELGITVPLQLVSEYHDATEPTVACASFDVD